MSKAAGSRPNVRERNSRGDNIVLIGYRGAGKTTVGRLLAQRLERPFIDTDEEIERAESRSIADVFASAGEPAFRAAERAVITRVTANAACVISVGGGAILDPANRAQLRASGLCIWLEAPPEELHSRITAVDAQKPPRPPLTDLSPAEEVRRMLAIRTPFYEALADHRVASNSRTPDEVAAAIVALL